VTYRGTLTGGVRVAAALAWCTASVALAHHSVAAFDRANPIAVTGTIKQFIWANPHTWIYLEVPNDKGGSDEWDLEGGAVNGLAKSGWKPDTLKAGMKVRLKVSPRRDGKIGGEYTEVLQVDGKPFENAR
jgi:hypothetical protein